MDIIIDVRALMGGKISGVEVYITSLLQQLFLIDRENRYLLFANSYSDQSRYLKKFERDNVRFFQTRIPNKLLNLALSLFNYPKLDRLITKKQKLFPDFNTRIFFEPDLRPVALSRNIKKILTVHDLSFSHFPGYFSLKTRLWHRILNPGKEINNSKKIIAVSDFTKSDLLKTFHVDPEKIIVIKEGVDENICADFNAETATKVRNKYNLPDKYFLFLATLEPRKNLPALVEAFKLFTKQDTKSIKLVLAGIKNRQIFSKLKLQESDRIKFTGFIDEEDKGAVFKMAEAFIYPSLYEGFGLPLLEAMKCGTPVITSNCSSMPEIVGNAALLVDPKDPKSIAAAMTEITKEDVVKKLHHAIPNQINQYSWNKCALETLAVITSL